MIVVLIAMNLFLATIIIIIDSILLPMMLLVLLVVVLRAFHNRWIFITIIIILLLVADWSANTDDDDGDFSIDNCTRLFNLGLVLLVLVVLLLLWTMYAPLLLRSISGSTSVIAGLISMSTTDDDVTNGNDWQVYIIPFTSPLVDGSNDRMVSLT